MQYSHATSDRELAARLCVTGSIVPTSYLRPLRRWRSVAGGSDALVEEPTPLAGLADAASAASLRNEAIARFTAEPAWLGRGLRTAAAGWSPGYDADFVILDGDRVRATMVGGE